MTRRGNIRYARAALFVLVFSFVFSVVVALVLSQSPSGSQGSTHYSYARIGDTLWFINHERRRGLWYWQLDVNEYRHPNETGRERESRLSRWYKRVNSSDSTASLNLLSQRTASLAKDISADPKNGTHSIDIIEFGLPLPCMSYVITGAPGSTARDLNERSAHRSLRIGNDNVLLPAGMHPLPLHVKWFALAANTAFYAVVTLGLVVTMRGLKTLSGFRTRSRLRRGLCPHCSYDLNHNHPAGCPECGWNKPPTPAAGPETQPTP